MVKYSNYLCRLVSTNIYISTTTIKFIFFHTLQKVCMLETLDDEYQDLCQVVAVLIAPLIFAQFLSIKAYHLISAG